MSKQLTEIYESPLGKEFDIYEEKDRYFTTLETKQTIVATSLKYIHKLIDFYEENAL